MFKASTTLLIVWIVLFVTSGVFTQEEICDLQQYPRPAGYIEDSDETQVYLTKDNVTFCEQQTCRGISLEELKACNDGSFPGLDEYLRLLNYTLKSKTDCEDTGDSDACQVVDENGEPAHDGDKCCRTYFGVVPDESSNRYQRNALGDWCYIMQTFSIGECRKTSKGRCSVCQNQTSLQYLDSYCYVNGELTKSFFLFESDTYCSCQNTDITLSNDSNRLTVYCILVFVMILLSFT